jgi:peptide deformylase
MIRTILTATEPSLRQKSKPVKKVDKKIRSLISDMKETLVAQEDPEGIGLAAPQIGKSLRIFLIKPKEKVKVIINPEIIEIINPRIKSSKKSATDRKKIMEGCLSLPHFYGPVKREKKVKLKYLNLKGEEVTETFTGLNAQIVLHEIDHLEGVLFVDHLLKQKRPLYEYINGEFEEVDLII